jgi:hypothetical protein
MSFGSSTCLSIKAVGSFMTRKIAKQNTKNSVDFQILFIINLRWLDEYDSRINRRNITGAIDTQVFNK